MNRLIALAGSSYNKLKTNFARRQALNALMRQNDATLRDIGISRELLHGGIDCWPWHAVERPTAAREPIRYSNRAPHDLGTTRNTISDVVQQDLGSIVNPDTDDVAVIGSLKQQDVTQYADESRAA